MLYFSELKGKKVRTEDGIVVGVLNDMIFQASDNPVIKKIVVKAPADPQVIIPIEFVKRLGDTVTLAKNYHIAKLEENELYLVNNLLDNQIIDIAGDKVVRVNDVVIQDKDGYYISGVDIGILGILRWFGVEDRARKLFSKVGKKLSSSFLSWADIHPLELSRGHVKIKKEQTKLEKIKPEDLADYLEKTTVINARRTLRVLDEKTAAQVISNLTINYQTALFKLFSAERAAKIISSIDPEEAVDVLLTLSKKKREKILSFVDDKVYKEIDYLLRLSKTPIGNILTREFLWVEPNMTVKEVIDKIKRQTNEFYMLFYIYVVNQERQITGVFDLHELLLQSPDTPIYKFMTQNVVVIHLTTPEVIVIRKMVKYRLVALPVVDRDKHILGLVTFDEVLDLFTKNYE